MEKQQIQEPKLDGRRKMALEGKQPDTTLDQVINWVKQDMKVLSSLVYMIHNDTEIIEFIAKKFHARIHSDDSALNEALKEVQKQKSQTN